MKINTPTPLRHGEYKVPGGKLVVVDLFVSDDLLTRVQLSGDFFLEPPEALDALNGALEGLSIDQSDNEMIEALACALPPYSEMFGLTLEAIVVVIRRALL